MGFEVMARPCNTCIYRKGSPLDIKKLEADTGVDGYRICHHHDTACCRGFWDRYKHTFQMGRIAQRLNAVEYVEATKYVGFGM